jgi:hypothetical protein
VGGLLGGGVFSVFSGFTNLFPYLIYKNTLIFIRVVPPKISLYMECLSFIQISTNSSIGILLIEAVGIE